MHFDFVSRDPSREDSVAYRKMDQHPKHCQKYKLLISSDFYRRRFFIVKDRGVFLFKFPLLRAFVSRENTANSPITGFFMTT